MSSTDRLILFTSGTTGPHPKAVVHTKDSLSNQIDALVSHWIYSPEDHLLLHLPLDHIHGLVTAALAALASGAKISLWERFHPRTIAHQLQSNDISIFTAVPSIYSSLKMTNPSLTVNSKLRLAISGSASLDLSTRMWWDQQTGTSILERYGSTEMGIVFSQSLDPASRQAGTVGSFLISQQNKGNHWIIAQDQELLVKSSTMADRYIDMSGLSNSICNSNGYFATGDLVSVITDASGMQLKILGRKSNVISVGANKIHAMDLSNKIKNAISSIKDCIVVAESDPIYGQRPVLYYESEAPIDDLATLLVHHLAVHELPVKCIYRSALPRSSMGKILKHQLA